MLCHACLVLALFAGVPSEPTLRGVFVRRIEVEGNHRIPAAGILRLISLAPGKPYSEDAVRADLRSLHDTGLFQDVSFDRQASGDGRVDVRIRVTEAPFLSDFVIAGVSPRLEHRIREMLGKERLELRPATPFNPAQAGKAAALVRNLLRAEKYPMADVSVVPEPSGRLVRAAMRIRTGPRLQVGKIEFTGNTSIPAGELRACMKHTRPGSLWAFWTDAGRYLPEELAADMESVRRCYQSRGYAAAQVGPPQVVARDTASRIPLREGRPKLRIRIPVLEGPRFKLASVAVEGDARMASGQIADLAREIGTPGRYDGAALESVRTRMTEALGRYGYAMADVRLEQSVDETERNVRAVYRISAGEPAVIGRIRFEGNGRIPDKFLRRELVTKEGDVFDSSRLDASLRRLNRSSLVKEVGRADVGLAMDEARQELDITFKVKENDLRGIYGTGGLAGGGYLGLVCSFFNLFGIGERISMELDGGAAQSNLLLNLVGNHFLGSPFSLALSAFHRYSNLNVANIVPGTGDIVGVFQRRSTGFGLAGSYPLTAKVQAGLGYQFARDEITGDAAPSITSRSEITPSVVFDSTRGSGPETRGYRVALARTWTGPALMNSIESGREAFRISTFHGDPLTTGRNSFAFQLQEGFAHSSAGALAPELRYYPGTEMARGFARGGLSSWGMGAAGPSDLHVLGADAMLGISAEYRVPLSGPLSSASFVDLAWTRLGAKNAGDRTGVTLIDRTSGILRASTGGELRLQLPVIRQPARLIFAWNPLRLDALVNGASPFHVADPRTGIRFALGDIF